MSAGATAAFRTLSMIHVIARLPVRISECQRVVIPGVKHFMSYQDPHGFNEAVLNFLADH